MRFQFGTQPGDRSSLQAFAGHPKKVVFRVQILCQLLTTAPIIFLPYSMGACGWVWPHWQSYKFAGCKDLMEESASEGPIRDTNTLAELMEVWGSGPSSVLLHLIISFLSYSLWMKNRFNSSLPRNKIKFNVFMIFYPFFLFHFIITMFLWNL